MASVSRLFQLSGTCNNYPWGKKGNQSLAAKLCKKTPGTDFVIDDDEFYSEMWFGDYPDFPARDLEKGQALGDLLKSNQEKLLGQYSVEKFGNNLPFLPKILSTGKALPLQIHPNKSLAAKLHEKDPKKFSDANHKPEIAVALSRFELFAGWKELNQISPMFNMPSLRRFVPEETSTWNEETLRTVTIQIIEEDLKRQSLEDIQKLGYPSSTFELIQCLQSQYSATDPGLLIAILCMQFFCMARSNNMLSSGLCPVADRDSADLFSEALKIDSSTQADSLKLLAKSGKDGYTTVYQPPIGEFDVVRVDMPAGKEESVWNHKGPTLAIAISGEGTILGDGKELDVKPGFIFFIAAATVTKLRADTDLQVYAAALR
ncbi:RmlC-like cupin domain-containing protein [Trichoderma austrokoningii]